MVLKSPLSRFLSTLALACALSLSSARARAQEAGGFAPTPAAGGGFGSVGQWVLTLGVNSSEYFFLHKQSGGGWQIGLRPTADYFIAPSLSVGGVIGFSHASGGATDFDIGARAGFNLNITGPWGFWPTAGIFANTHSEMHATNTSARLGIFAPFLYHIVPHLFVGLGPSFNLGLTNGAGNQYGLDAILGGWF